MDANVSRRKFLKICGAAVGASVLGTRAGSLVQGSEIFGAGASRTKFGMTVDLKLCEETSECDGLNSCMHACKTVNITPPNSYWMYVIESEEISFAERLPRPCMHCENPPCVKVCPVGATFRRMDGIVIVDYARCIGCRLCAVACPYGARYFNWKQPTKSEIEKTRRESWAKVEEVWKLLGKEVPLEPDAIEIPRPAGVIEKCNFCIHRVYKGLKPACVAACPGALKFGDLGDPKSEVSKILKERKWLRLIEEFNTRPSVYYLR